MRDPEIAGEVSALLAEQAQCVLATMDDIRPCQHMMAYAYSDDLFTIYLATLMDTRKFRNMLSNPRVSMMWDNRSVNHRACGGYEMVDIRRIHRTSTLGDVPF